MKNDASWSVNECYWEQSVRVIFPPRKDFLPCCYLRRRSRIFEVVYNLFVRTVKVAIGNRAMSAKD